VAARSAQGAQNTLKRKAFELTSLSQLLRSLSHKSVLDRGFALVRGAGDKVIRRAAALKATTALDIEFADGHVSAHYLGPEAEAGEPVPRRRPTAQASRRTVPVKKDNGSQGSLL
jgi:exodeoxyribonuclease VII large subunit